MGRLVVLLMVILAFAVNFWLGIVFSVIILLILISLLKAILDEQVPAVPKYRVYDKPEGGLTIYEVNGFLTPMKPERRNLFERLIELLESP